jgi:hypothetical protein
VSAARRGSLTIGAGREDPATAGEAAVVIDVENGSRLVVAFTSAKLEPDRRSL